MDDSVIANELAKLTDELVAVHEGECLGCYLDRTIPRFGCREHALTERWNAAQPRRIPRLLSWLKARGGYCDCEVVLNVLFSGRPMTRKELRCDNAFAQYREDEPEESGW